MNYAQLDKVILPVVWIGFACASFLFIVISLILNYHWTRYGINAARLRKVRTVYFSVSGVLLFAMLGFAILLAP